MKTHLILVLLLLSSGLWSQSAVENPKVTTRGTATVYVEPDEALMSFTIITEGEDLVDARAKNSALSSKAIAFLKSVGVQSKHIQTQYLHAGVRYKNYRQQEETRYFEASQSFMVCVTDLDRYEETIIGLLGQGVGQLSSPTFRSTKIREIKDEARRKAVIAAREKAQLLALELGQDIGAAVDISEVVFENQWGTPNQNAYSNAVTETPSTPGSDDDGFALGQLEVKASIDVSFRLITD